MERLLRSCKAHYLGPVIFDMGLTSVQDLAMCEPCDLEADLGISRDVAAALIDKARDMSVFETRKAAVQKTWKHCQDTFAVSATQLFYEHLFQEYPELQTFFASTDMDAQANKLYMTVSLAVQYLDEVENLIPTLQELGVRVGRQCWPLLSLTTGFSFSRIVSSFACSMLWHGNVNGNTMIL